MGDGVRQLWSRAASATRGAPLRRRLLTMSRHTYRRRRSGGLRAARIRARASARPRARRGRFATLPARAHAVYELAPGLLLVFKPRGHRESLHAHPYPQRLRVLRGCLEVTTARGVLVVDAGARALRIVAGRAHATRARRDTWLLVDRP